MTEEEENYWIIFDMLTEMLQGVSVRGDIPRQHIVTPFADVLAALALKSGGTVALRETIGHLVERLEQAATGAFPPGR